MLGDPDTEVRFGGPWQPCADIHGPRAGHQTVVVHGRAYTTGGYRYDPAHERLVLYRDVQFADLTRPGAAPSEWSRTHPFHGARSGHASVVADAHLYIIGGGDGLEFFDDVQHAVIDADGGIVDPGWRLESSRLVIPRSAAGCGVLQRRHDRFVYVAGGATRIDGRIAHLDSVEYARIHDDGTLGPFTLSPSRFIEGRAHCGVAIVGDVLYVLGGWGDHDLYADAQQATIADDGSIGPWSTRRATLNFARFGHATVACGTSSRPLLLVLGGVLAARDGDGTSRRVVGPTSRGRCYDRPGTYQGDAQYTHLSAADATPWVPLPSECDFRPRRWGHAAVVHGDHLYVIGGNGAPGRFLSDVLRVRLVSREDEGSPSHPMRRLDHGDAVIGSEVDHGATAMGGQVGSKLWMS